jgi:hypothetical protein
MRRQAELEWEPNEIIHSPRITCILRDVARACVKEVSPNCKNLSSDCGPCDLVGLWKIGANWRESRI